MSDICQDAESFDILQMNVTSLGPQKVTWLMGEHCNYDIVLLQEHKLRGNRLRRIAVTLKRKYDVYIHPAPILHTGPRGGVAILVKKGRASSQCNLLRHERESQSAVK